MFLTIDMYIGSTRLLEVISSNAKYDLEEKFHEGYTGADWGNEGKIKAIAIDNNKNNDDKDPQNKTRQWKKEKQWLKQAVE